VHWRLLRDTFAAQDGRCPYSGDGLTLGLNAALDHILPTSRFPGRRFDPSNVEWVADWVNLMKQDATPDEFLDRIRRILVYRS
jgi:CRISPR/Cas system Type II protein with McrA/HNH and RuvC-like nuclease domain